MYTTSTIFLRTLAEECCSRALKLNLSLKRFLQCGITHAFVNWGSDHPGFLEELGRQRTANGKTDLEIVTCPNEMVALSAAQGFAQASGRPAAVLVHVDVGTQVSLVLICSDLSGRKRCIDCGAPRRRWQVLSTMLIEEECLS